MEIRLVSVRVLRVLRLVELFAHDGYSPKKCRRTAYCVNLPRHRHRASTNDAGGFAATMASTAPTSIGLVRSKLWWEVTSTLAKNTTRCFVQHSSGVLALW